MPHGRCAKTQTKYAQIFDWHYSRHQGSRNSAALSTEGDLLIIYETEAEEWASYLGSIFTGSIAETSICRYDITAVASKRYEHLQLAGYKCKLLILSRGVLGNLCPARRAFLTRVLQPASRVVVLLCGVETPAPLLDAVPLEEGFLQISSEQDAQHYLAAVMKIIQRGTVPGHMTLGHASAFL